MERTFLCAGCGEEKPAAPRGPLPTWCPPCKQAEENRKRREDPAIRERHRAYNRAWKAANYERQRAYDRKFSRTSKYGLTEADLLALYEYQAGTCAICSDPHALDDLVIDHDHACCPGPRSCGSCVRGLLCRNCNLLLGHALDDVSRLLAAATYLVRPAQQTPKEGRLMDIHERIALLKEEVKRLTAILDAEGLMVVGSTGQPRVHPAVAERHAAIALLHRLESRIDPEAGPSALDDFLGGGA